LVELGEREREEGRRAVHSESIPFQQWVQQRGGRIDVEGLVPFTRWLTPANIPKRFSTQMYLYFLPLNTSLDSRTDQSQLHIPTPDGGIEHTAARFLYPREWLDLALADSVVLFPPQFFLLSLIAPFLAAPSTADPADSTEQFFREQRQRLMEFVEEDGDPKWGEKCISPNPIKQVGRFLIMGMGDAGPEVEGWGRRGDGERVLRVEVGGDGDRDRDRGRRRMVPREVVWRRDVLGAEGGKL